MKHFLGRIVARIFEFQARRLVKRHKLLIVAVGGSVGKTSTKTAVAGMLEQKYPGAVLAHKGNYNSEVSIPVSMFDIDLPDMLYSPFVWIRLILKTNKIIKGPFKYKVIVLELGTDKPGDIAKFLHYLRPDYGVVTAIAPEHMEFFKTIEAVAEEEFTLAKGSKKAVLNADDKRLSAMAKSLEASTLLYGAKGESRVVNLQLTPQGYRGNFISPAGTFEAQTLLLGEHSLYAVLAAVSIAADMGYSEAELRKGVQAFQPVNGRMVVLAGKNQSTIIDDSYNSSPDATLAAVQTLLKVEGKRKIAILGSMNELGDLSQHAHEQLGAACVKADLLITIGDLAERWLAPAAKAAGLSEEQVKSFSSPYDAGAFAVEHLLPGDVVLVKGSQNGVFSEEAIKPLLQNPEDEQKLVRQSPTWLAKKQAQFK
jgi:UDP-N-acetylmuramoyl-tripeptide--D-alanyl-D-alanine ligase